MPSGFSATGTADSRLYLRETELDQGARAVRDAYRQLRRLAHDALNHDELSPPEIDILIELVGAPDMDMTALREALDEPKQTFTRRIQRMEEKALIHREKCTQDKRRKFVKLTATGAALAEQAAKGWRDMLANTYVAAGPEEVASARKLLAMLGASGDAKETE